MEHSNHKNDIVLYYCEYENIQSKIEHVCGPFDTYENAKNYKPKNPDKFTIPVISEDIISFSEKLEYIKTQTQNNQRYGTVAFLCKKLENMYQEIAKKLNIDYYSFDSNGDDYIAFNDPEGEIEQEYGC